MPPQQGAQNHDAALGGNQPGRRLVQGFQNEFRQPVEGKNVEPLKPGQFARGQQLAFKLEGGLFGREQH